MRFDPFRDLDRLRQQVYGAGERTSVMAMDAYRHGDTFIVRFDLPGIDPSSIDLTVEKNVLTVRAERKWEEGEEDEVLVAERPQGSFSRQLFLGEGLDTEHIQATYENGVLALTIPVAEQAKPRKVEIATASSGAQPIDTSSSVA
jgi:HSP20 family protein